MVKKYKIFGNTLDNLVKYAEEELKRESTSSSNADDSKNSKKVNKKRPISCRYVVKHVPPEIQEFIQFFTKHEGFIYNNNSSI